MSAAWDIILEGRQSLAAGQRLWTKGSGGVPSRLRKVFLSRIDRSVPVTLTTAAAAALTEGEKPVVEHLVPMKRIAIEIIDPAGHDPRTGGLSFKQLGPARDLAHAEEIARQMLVKAHVTEAEHARLNTAGRSIQWDAPGGDGFARYCAAGIALLPVDRAVATALPPNGAGSKA